jgi:hypothetical protein
MSYANLDKLLNVVLKLKYDWISDIEIPYHYSRFGNVEIYYVHIHINENIFNIVDEALFPKKQYKIPIDEFEKQTKTNFRFLKRDIDNLFHNQILSGRIEQDIWIFIPKQMR